MKTKKIVIGAMAAAMLSLSVCSVAPAVAADETVQISVGKTTAEAGGAFTVDVTIADIPTAGIQAVNFALEYDSSIITIPQNGVKAGSLTETGAAGSDASSSLLPNFNSYTDGEGVISVMWSTSLEDSSYWLKGSGVICTITGTVASSATPGAVADIKVVPTVRETFDGSGVTNKEINAGYLKDGEAVKYTVNAVKGNVTVSGGTTPGNVLRGDANCDNNVTIADATAILQHLGNKDKYGLTEQGLLNGDVAGNNDGITIADANRIQQYDAGVLTLAEL